MDSLEIEGGNSLVGEIWISGAKNSALPLLCLGLMAEGSLTYTNVPKLADTILIESFCDIMGLMFRGMMK